MVYLRGKIVGGRAPLERLAVRQISPRFLSRCANRDPELLPSAQPGTVLGLSRSLVDGEHRLLEVASTNVVSDVLHGERGVVN
jgi:hypothetical protein